ncbi:MAG: acylneuraminate cytidylyltransferase family protein [Maribacter sp.]
MKIVALLPMKGNSEKVSNKNMKDFFGKPLYHRVLDSLLASDFVDKIVINTDSRDIKEDVNLNYPKNVIVLDRPKEIMGDNVSMNKIIEHDVNTINADLYLQTHSTNPMLKTETLDTAIKTYLEKKDKYDSVFSVTRIQTRLYGSDGSPLNHDPVKLLRTWDLPPIYEENSNLYIFTKKSFENAGNKRIGANALMFEMDPIEAKDIDEFNDFLIAESLFKNLK